jgi:hypothetical protein
MVGNYEPLHERGWEKRYFCRSMRKQTAASKDLEFPSTHWSIILTANQSDAAAAEAALGRFFRRYQAPLLAYLRGKFHCDEDRAQDWLQHFILEQILQKEWLRQVHRIEGKRFRAFLLCALHNFVNSQIRGEHSQKRMPAGGVVPIDSLTELETIVPKDAAAQSFDLTWARCVINSALQQMQAYCEEENRADIWGVFDGRVRAPILDGMEPTPYEHLVQRFELESPIQAHNVLATGKRLFARCLRNVIAEYATNEADLEAELRELHWILAH